MTTGDAQVSSILHYFVDEAGDPTLFDRKGRNRVGEEGCSKYFMLGKLDVGEPERLARELNDLRRGLLADPYFKGIPSMQPERRKTAIGFHANDDVAEVRREVYKLLAQHDLRFYAVVRDKRALMESVKQKNKQDRAYTFRPNELYDSLVQELFRGLHRLADETRIYYARRGSKSRTAAFGTAIKQAEKEFERSFGFRRKSDVEIVASTPPEEAGLQAVDYFLWALQRFYNRGEDRFIEMLEPQMGEIYDLDFVERKSRGVHFRQGKPLNLRTRLYCFRWNWNFRPSEIV